MYDRIPLRGISGNKFVKMEMAQGHLQCGKFSFNQDFKVSPWPE